ncbi:MAG: hypothetical protein LBV01_00615 [Deltaproteobacteria bacterium]|nr:hypothetical protein [Deltaproteobacteria bacterium]
MRLGGLGPSIFFIAGDTACKPGDAVIVEMEEGQAFGTVTALMRMLPAHVETGQGDGVAGGRLRPVSRKATEKDAATAGSNAALSAEAFGYCQDCIRERGLDMKLVDVLVLHDRGKMIFYFTAPARIDFRELVKDLVRRYRTRIELRQIGVRHETQMVGALGNCGMVCCCRRYLRKFAPVAIKMAKEQNVFLNPVKISGICGRLLCCLAYEQEHYDEFYRSCPKLGKKYQTDAGAMRVLRASLFRESVTVLTETGEEAEYSLSDWNGLKPFRPNAVQQQGQPGKKQRQDAGRPVRNGQPAPQEKSGGGREERLAAPDPDDAPLWEAEPLPDSVEPLPFEEAGGIFQEAALPDDDDDDDGGSIFGLAPKRRLESGGAGVPKGGEQAAGGRREWPGRQGGRRGQRPGP